MERIWPIRMYHMDYPDGRLFYRQADIPSDAVSNPADLGIPAEEIDPGDEPAETEAPRRKGGRPRKVVI